MKLPILYFKSKSLLCFWLKYVLKAPLSSIFVLTSSEMTPCDVKRLLLLLIPESTSESAALQLSKVLSAFGFTWLAHMVDF